MNLRYVASVAGVLVAMAPVALAPIMSMAQSNPAFSGADGAARTVTGRTRTAWGSVDYVTKRDISSKHRMDMPNWMELR